RPLAPSAFRRLKIVLAAFPEIDWYVIASTRASYGDGAARRRSSKALVSAISRLRCSSRSESQRVASARSKGRARVRVAMLEGLVRSNGDRSVRGAMEKEVAAWWLDDDRHGCFRRSG